jgi:hypothetical protein
LILFLGYRHGTALLAKCGQAPPHRNTRRPCLNLVGGQAWPTDTLHGPRTGDQARTHATPYPRCSGAFLAAPGVHREAPAAARGVTLPAGHGRVGKYYSE